MPGLIEELVSDASDATKPVNQLLRRMKVAAVRLKLDDLEEWVEHELNGYPHGTPVPDYRIQSGIPMGEHVIHGHQPLNIDDEATRALLRLLPIPQSIGSIESLIAQPGKGNSIYWFNFPDHITARILDHNRGILRSVGLRLDESRLVDVVDAVRDRILTWALSMEKAGVTGEGLSFTQAEQKAAQGVTNNFYGDNARINQNSTDNSTNTVVHGNLFGDLKSSIEQGVSDEAERRALVGAIAEMESKQGKVGFAGAYGKFIALAANHMQLVSPFLPGLTLMLSS
jgi:hypothetical protein